MRVSHFRESPEAWLLHGGAGRNISAMADGSPLSRVDSGRFQIGAIVLLLAAIAFSYGQIAFGLIAQWSENDNYSHGFLIVPLAVYFGWTRRAALRRSPQRPSLWGLLVVSLGLCLYVAGIAAAELFVARLSLVGIIAGAIMFLFGPRHLRVLAFPVGFLLLMIPPPEILFNQVALPLQSFASQAGATMLRAAGVPVLRDGNVLELVSMRLEVAEACSGIRSVVSLLTFALALGEISGCETSRVVLLSITTIPLAIAANATRVAAIGLAAHAWGRPAAEGVLHGTSGLLVFALAVAVLIAVERATARMGRAVAPSVAS
jgi:exosortase